MQAWAGPVPSVCLDWVRSLIFMFLSGGAAPDGYEEGVGVHQLRWERGVDRARCGGTNTFFRSYILQ